MYQGDTAMHSKSYQPHLPWLKDDSLSMQDENRAPKVDRYHLLSTSLGSVSSFFFEYGVNFQAASASAYTR